MASAVGSVTGSFANGVSRFSRLFSDQVNDEPEAVTIVPKLGLAMTLTQGCGVSWSPSRTMTYSRPPSAKPPSPLASASGGTFGGSTGAGVGPGLPRPRDRERSDDGRVRHREVELVRQASAVAAQDRARHAGEEEALGLRHAVAAKQVGAALPVLPRPPRPVVEQGRQLGVHLVEVADRVLVHDDHVGAQPLEAPVLLRLQDLPHQPEVGVGDDAHEQDREVAGDAVRPRAPPGPGCCGPAPPGSGAASRRRTAPARPAARRGAPPRWRCRGGGAGCGRARRRARRSARRRWGRGSAARAPAPSPGSRPSRWRTPAAPPRRARGECAAAG